MASSITAFGLLAVLCAFSVLLPGATSQEETSLVPAEAAVNSFALDLYRALVNEPGVTNLAFAPLSISAGLSALYFGAKGETRRQIHDALRFKDDASPAWLTGRVAEFQAEAVDEKGIIKERNLFNIVTRVFLAKGIPVNPDFSESVGGTQSINFGDPASAVEEINDFVYEETEGLISGLMGENTIDHRTSMVLVNAIYFKGLWKTQFDETRPGKFKGVQGTQEVDFMFVTGTFNRAQRTDIGATVLELPYKNSAFSMFILLPFREDGFDAMEEAIRGFDDEIFKDSMKEENDMYISLPKFGFQAQLDLSVLLPGLGIVDVFDAEKSNLSGISDSKGLHLSSAVHRALIQVDEVGTVAAATTEGIITPLAAPPIFTADRPFMFVIRDNVEDMVLFMGRVMSI